MSEPDIAQERIAQVAQDYFDGMFYGDEAKLQRAFHADAFIIGHFEGELEWSSLSAFIDLCIAESTMAAGESYEARIESIDITGDSAVAKVINLYLGIWFTDYLSMLERDGRWQIINKLYFAHPQE